MQQPIARVGARHNVALCTQAGNARRARGRVPKHLIGIRCESLTVLDLAEVVPQ
jgi:hypothetical protein